MATLGFSKALLFVLFFSLALSLALAGCLSKSQSGASQQNGVVTPSVQATSNAAQSSGEELPPRPPGDGAAPKTP
ncbi:MAG TPA: hypothetical protein VI875_03360 [Candidatus Norongarragalinales archaeon]|nr:hypothetical protein [Candidatus Norongarragalinales archaeon]